MRGIGSIRSIIFFFFFLCAAVPGNALADDLDWGDFVIDLSDKWTAQPVDADSPDSRLFTTSQDGLSAFMQVDKERMPEMSEDEYYEWLARYEQRWKSAGFKNPKFFSSGPNTVLGVPNCPYAVGENRGLLVYNFLPYRDGRVRLVMGGVDASYGKETPPGFIVEALSGVRMKSDPVATAKKEPEGDGGLGGFVSGLFNDAEKTVDAVMSSDEVQSARSGAGELWDTTKRKTTEVMNSEEVQSAKQGAQDLWEKGKRKTAEMVGGSAAMPSEEEAEDGADLAENGAASQADAGAVSEPVQSPASETPVPMPSLQEVMAKVPPVKAAPFIDLNEITAAQWDGAVTAAMEGMRLIYGDMNAKDEAKFQETWGVLRQYPHQDVVDYLNKFNPLLAELLSLRTTVNTTAALLEQAMVHAYWAAEIDDPFQVAQYTSLGEQYRNLLVAQQKRMDAVIKKLVDLGDVPDGAALMLKNQQEYMNQLNYLRRLRAKRSDPEGEWIGYMHYPKGVPFLEGAKYEPIYFYVYATGEPKKYYGFMLDAGDYEEKEFDSIDILPMEEMGLAEHFKGDSFNFSYSDEGERFTITAKRYTDGDMPVYPQASPDVYLKALKISEAERERILNDDRKDGFESIAAVAVDSMTKSAVQDQLRHFRLRSAFHRACVEFEKDPDYKKGDVVQAANLFDNLVAGHEVERVPLPSKKKQPEAAVAVTTHTADGKVKLNMVDDKTPEERRKVDWEAIEERQANIAIWTKIMECTEKEMQETEDPARKADLMRTVLGQRADIQAEQDRIATLKTGTIVHTRSEWDNYAQAQFIQKIAEDQQRYDKITLSLRRAQKMADNLPPEKADEVRRILKIGYENPEVLGNGNTKQASKVLGMVYQVANEHWNKELAQANSDAYWANVGLKTAEYTKTAADYSLMVASLYGGPHVNTVYQGITGYIEGGPKESFLRLAGSYNKLTGVLVDGYRGMDQAVKQGGGYLEIMHYASWEIAKGMFMDMAMSGIAGRIHAGKTGDVPGGSTRTGEVGSAPKTAKAGDAPDVGMVKAKAKAKGVPDDGFNRAINDADMKQYRQEVADARVKVKSYKKKFQELERARQEGAAPEKIKKLETELEDRASAIHESAPAKMMMKTHERNPKNRKMTESFVDSMDRVHSKTQQRFEELMAGQGYTKEQMEAIRNADSGKTVNTDYDNARKVQYGPDGKPLPPMKNGKPVAEVVWMQDAQRAWNQAYRDTTGRSPEMSWETVTTSKHAEAYVDKNVIMKRSDAEIAQARAKALKEGKPLRETDKITGIVHNVEARGGILEANKAWAGQTADVNKFKADHLRGSPEFGKVQKYVEISRSTSKECNKRLMPLLDSKMPPKSDVKNYNAWLKHKYYWTKVNKILGDVGSGRMDPSEGDRKLRLLTGGKSSLEVTHDLRTFMEALIKM
ncbi:hypothetical protein GM415_02365 [Pseudodesulfovibrio cashew]|uniref:Uncharacterized protein n=1 Tax=Pseudodesulfovibrio cashew TaxID=2678688 RepID=A0A6I6J870_9BACT|nr:hypothetical protein [Pseudodesulfovibrio cashew]QGY39026.1 hypothetical protein GM415_02365 [Pseudodesulfovibrio cashew]